MQNLAVLWLTGFVHEMKEMEHTVPISTPVLGFFLLLLLFFSASMYFLSFFPYRAYGN